MRITAFLIAVCRIFYFQQVRVLQLIIEQACSKTSGLSVCWKQTPRTLKLHSYGKKGLFISTYEYFSHISVNTQLFQLLSRQMERLFLSEWDVINCFVLEFSTYHIKANKVPGKQLYNQHQPERFELQHIFASVLLVQNWILQF
jgi:hypothetical protein